MPPTVELHVPGDKSISHRALMFAALSDGRCTIEGILRSHDLESTALILRSYGVDVPRLADRFQLTGGGLHSLRAPRSQLDCGNSGTSLRLFTGIAAGLPAESTFVGDASLSRRPMRRLARLLEMMGASFDFASVDGLPMTVRGPVTSGGEFSNDTASAQIKSALLLAGLVGGQRVVVSEPRRSRDHTELMLQALGASLERAGDSVTMHPTESLAAFDIRVPGDPSSAAFLAARAILAPGSDVIIRDVCLNPTRTGFFGALARMGADVQLEPTERRMGEDVGTVRVRHSQLSGIELEAADVPALVDELPLIGCLATRASGELRVTGAGELRLKESDRIETLVRNLRAIGADAEELPDGFVVRGRDQVLRGSVETRADHRIAMAFGVLGSVPGYAVSLDDPSCVAISYPDFWQALAAMAA